MLLFLEKNREVLRMDTLLTLVVALGGIVTGMGAIWAALVARRQAQVTERSLVEQNERTPQPRELDLRERTRLGLVAGP
jgi:hypothetical protein